MTAESTPGVEDSEIAVDTTVTENSVEQPSGTGEPSSSTIQTTDSLSNGVAEAPSTDSSTTRYLR